ncbi:Exportin-T [Orchesella cincta]|uniref:Exportin-T n=1 Tax=Orchesella cincta TaxID=48709 RepID=A0A1D2MW42_ORCCI|nr:Exportin-T [Orchesella cincta]
MDELMYGVVNASDPADHVKAVQIFEQLKNSPNGWIDCVGIIRSRRFADCCQIIFFNLQVIEHHVKTRYAVSTAQEQEVIRSFLRDWPKIQAQHDGSPPESYVSNKVAQISALVYVQDYPTRWPKYFDDLIAICDNCGTFLNHFLLVLLAIDGEIADRDIPRSAQELQRNTLIKDTMREKVVIQLVEFWYKILTLFNGRSSRTTKLCLEVIGKYIQWIDINLVANDRFVPVLVTNLCNQETREAAADCITEVISKGMDPIDKTKLVESFARVLAEAGVWVAFVQDQDEDYLCKLGKLYCVMGTNLIESYWKFSKSHPAQKVELKVVLDAIETKIPLLLQILGHECDDVSATVLDFVRDYLHLVKSFRDLSEANLKDFKASLLDVVIRKLRFDSSYDFNHEGEDEACFLEYRKQLKIIFDNLGLLDKNYLVSEVQKRLHYTSQTWNMLSFDEVEVSLLLFYYLGETVPTTMSGQWSAAEGQLNPIQQMMVQVMNSDMYMCQHSAVVLQYFETIIRYEKFFVCHPEYIVKGLSAFLKEKGLFHTDLKVRSRCCYLFSRFIKCIRTGITTDLMKSIIDAIQPLLAIQTISADRKETLISRDDQLYLYEVIGVLIVSGESESQKKTELMTDIVNLVLYPCRLGMEQLKTIKDPSQHDPVVEVLLQAIALTGRLSKAFSSQQTMKSLGCVPIFLEALSVFLQLLEAPVDESFMVQLQSSVRQYLHRLVVCLEEELLPYIPLASQALLKNCDCKSIQEYIPLINQVITKFKLSWIFQKEVVPFLKQMFTPMVQGVFAALQVPIEQNDLQAQRERQLLRRQYFQFIAAIVTNNVTDVLSAQDPNVLNEVMMTVIQGSVDFPDPVAQKACFSILKKLVDLWAGPEGPDGFMDFMYKNIVPACFMAPLKLSFDINDAQTLIALNEVANCLKSVLIKRKEEFIAFMITYLPTLKISPETTQEFVNALQSDNKNFRQYLKVA